MVNQFDYLSKRVVYSPDDEALFDISSNTHYTYRKLNNRANQVANYLQEKLSFQKGDRCAVIAFNTAKYWEVIFGVQKCGGIIVGVNFRLVTVELKQMLEDTQPKLVFYDQNTKNLIDELENIYQDTYYLPFDESYNEQIYSQSELNPVTPKLDYDDPIGIVFTGGTTGLPKGAMISYRQVAFNTLNTVRDILPGDTYINHLPLFHVGGVYVYPIPLFILGGRVIQMQSWDADLFLELVTNERPNFGFCVPTQYRMLMNSPKFKHSDFSSLRFFTSGGEPLSLQIIRTFKDVHGIIFKQGFGMTEVGPGCFALDPKDAERKIGSIGTPNFFIDAKIVDTETGAECKPNEPGELLLKGPTVTIGYWNRPELNEKLLDEEGYFRTGDLVRKDEEGYYFVLDRIKDMFISGGENVYPREIEKTLEGHPQVTQAQVIGIHNEKWGEVGRALVVLKEGQTVSEEELLVHCRNNLAKFKVPKSIVFVNDFNAFISGAGKILKRELAKKYGI
jgi:fatty-acyl-CoA synthase